MFIGKFKSDKFLIASVIVFSIGNLLIALLQHYYVIVIIRIVQGALLPAILSIIVLEAVHLAGKNRSGWAISQANLGIAVATVLGIPAGALIANQLGWPASFISLALLGVITASLLVVSLPKRNVKEDKRTSVVAEVALLWRAAFLFQLLLSAILFAGMFTSYTYIAALLTKISNIGSAQVGWLLMGFGICGIVGNWLAGRFVGSNAIIATAVVALMLSLSMVSLSLMQNTPMQNFPFVMVLIVVLWGASHMAAFVINQVRVMQAGKNAQSLALSLNISACNLGIALGAILGGYVVQHYGVEFVGYAGAATVAIALVMAIAFMIFTAAADQ